MLKARNPDQSRITYRGKVYSIYVAFTSKRMAEDTAEHTRTLQGRIHTYTYTRAVTVDLGVDAGRDRYAVFTAKGRPI